MKILLVTLVTVFCLQFSLLSYASQSQNWQSKDKEILLEKTNGRLNLARKEVQNVKEKINFIYANTDKTRKIIMKERQSLKRSNFYPNGEIIDYKTINAQLKHDRRKKRKKENRTKLILSKKS